MQHSWLDVEVPRGAPSVETSDSETSQKLEAPRLPCTIQNQHKSEANLLMKLISKGRWDVFVGFIFILCLSYYYPICF